MAGRLPAIVRLWLFLACQKILLYDILYVNCSVSPKIPGFSVYSGEYLCEYELIVLLYDICNNAVSQTYEHRCDASLADQITSARLD